MQERSNTVYIVGRWNPLAVGLLLIYAVVYAVLLVTRALDLTTLSWWWVNIQVIVPAAIVALAGAADLARWVWLRVREATMERNQIELRVLNRGEKVNGVR